MVKGDDIRFISRVVIDGTTGMEKRTVKVWPYFNVAGADKIVGRLGLFAESR